MCAEGGRGGGVVGEGVEDLGYGAGVALGEERSVRWVVLWWVSCIGA